MQISVVVATFGDESWNTLAERALCSIDCQSRPADEIIRIHRDTLQQARNEGVRACQTEYVCLLDADDELDPYYLASMNYAIGDLRYPRIQYVYEDGSKQLLESSTDLMCIGTCFKKELFLQVGGFGTEPILEDYALWQRMIKAGATVGASQSIYIAHKRKDSRNSNEELKTKWMEIIGY